MTNKQTRQTRSDVPTEQTWDLTDLFSSDDQWAEALEAIQDEVTTITQYKGCLGTSSDTLLQCLTAMSRFQQHVAKVANYAMLKANADGTDSQNQSDSSKVQATLARINAELSFVESELLSIPTEKIEQFLGENEALKTYEKMLTDILEKKPYTLTAELEKMLAAFSEVLEAPYAIYQRSKLSDMQFEDIQDKDGTVYPMSFALYEDRYELSANHHLRREAFASFTNTLDQYKHTFAATYATEVTKQVTLARVRGYDSVTDMLLQSQQVTQEMYHNQLDVGQQELAPLMRKYAKLKQKQLGLTEMRHCDLQVSIDPDFNPKTTYDEAADIIISALNVMGPEYRAIMEKALSERWVDYADNIGKATGAFCASPYGVHSYILMTWTDTMRGAFVLAHELGHAGHFTLASKHQDIVNSRASTYFIEAPSTLNELLLADHLMANTDDQRMQNWIIDQLMGTYYHNFVTHLLEGAFQRRVYDLAETGTPLTADVLCQQKKETLESFWGDAVVIDDEASLTWMRQPHYYMGLYPYTYSAGLTISTAMAQRIKEEGEPAVNRWLDVLRAGGSKKPLDLIKQAGIDMSKPDAIKEAVAHIGSLIDRLIESYR